MATIEKRTAKARSTRYRVRVRLKGDTPRTRTFKRLTDAKAWAASVETDLRRSREAFRATSMVEAQCRAPDARPRHAGRDRWLPLRAARAQDRPHSARHRTRH